MAKDKLTSILKNVGIRLLKTRSAKAFAVTALMLADSLTKNNIEPDVGRNEYIVDKNLELVKSIERKPYSDLTKITEIGPNQNTKEYESIFIKGLGDNYGFIELPDSNSSGDGPKPAEFNLYDIGGNPMFKSKID